MAAICDTLLVWFKVSVMVSMKANIIRENKINQQCRANVYIYVESMFMLSFCKACVKLCP